MDESLELLLRSIEAVVFDFDGVFTDNTVFVDQHGIESVRCWRSDGLGLARLRALEVKVLILSTEANPIVTTRATKLTTECVQGVADKAAALMTWASANDILLSRIAFVGNDINDMPAFRIVGLPIGVADSADEVSPLVRLRTTRPGGFGAVREVCDLIWQVRKAQ